MRFIIHELPYERPVAAGQFRYERDGQLTGALESWRLTDAVDGYRFLRVDLDARAAPSRRSVLYHLTLDPEGRPEQLKYRYWAEGLEASGAVVLEGGSIIAAREVNGVAYEDTAGAAALWFPSTVGLSLLRAAPRDVVIPSVTLDAEASDPARLMALLERPLRLADEDERQMWVGWDGGERRLWLDENGYPVRMRRDDGLSATAVRLVQYSRQPGR